MAYLIGFSHCFVPAKSLQVLPVPICRGGGSVEGDVYQVWMLHAKQFTRVQVSLPLSLM